MHIPITFANLHLACPECRYGTKKGSDKTTPDEIAGHLVETHGYSVEDVQWFIDAWVVSYNVDDQGRPNEYCGEHGYYPIENIYCSGCAEVDRQIDDAKELKGVKL